jgi:TPP-dependent pyruvate/acetoin dehydrogenase alpha subunit
LSVARFELETVRLFGHAGSDVETNYLTQSEIENFESLDPLMQSAKILLSNNILSPQALLDLYEENRKKIIDQFRSDYKKKFGVDAALHCIPDLPRSL